MSDRDPRDLIGLPATPLDLEDLPREVSFEEMVEHLRSSRLAGGIPREMSLASSAAILRHTGPPGRLEAMVKRGASTLMGADGGERLKELARTARTALDYLEDRGAEYDWQRDVVQFPPGDRGGRPELPTAAVGAAFEQVGGKRRDDWYGRETTDAIRERLAGLLAPEELTHSKIKSRLQGYLGDK